MTPSPTTDPRTHLRQRLKSAMVERDRPAVEVLRVAIAAVENAEAQPLDHVRVDGAPVSSGALEDAPASTEVARRTVDDEEVLAILTAELDELRAAAAHYAELGQAAAAADRARDQAEVLRELLTGGLDATP